MTDTMLNPRDLRQRQHLVRHRTGRWHNLR